MYRLETCPFIAGGRGARADTFAEKFVVLDETTAGWGLRRRAVRKLISRSGKGHAGILISHNMPNVLPVSTGSTSRLRVRR